LILCGELDARIVNQVKWLVQNLPSGSGSDLKPVSKVSS
jgi:hypothetical protein